MAHVVRLLTLGFLLFVQPSYSAVLKCPVEEDDSSPKNNFVTGPGQLCRPFVNVENPQVVRVVNVAAIPDNGMVRIQAQTCTGVVIGARTVLTARHCIETKQGEFGKIIAGFVRTTAGELYPIRLRSPDPHEDISMLTVSDDMGIKPAGIAPRGKLTAALSLQGYGCLYDSDAAPLDRAQSYPLARAGAPKYVIDNMLYMSGCVCHGDSGGPVFDADGKLVALMVRTDNEGLMGRGVLVHDFLNAP